MAKDIRVRIIGDASSLERALKQSQIHADNLGSKMSKLAKGAVVAAGAAGIGAVAVGLRAGIKEYMEAARVAAQTNAAIESTGGVAGVTAQHVEKLAQTMLRKTGIDDEATKVTENMLLTFTNVRNVVGANNDIFDQATKAVADMATRMNGGAIPSAEQLSTTSIKLGKALNDPIKGITALSRVGVQFTAAQKDQIKALVDSGKVMDAQKIILRELNKEFGGSAEAAGKTLPGQLNKLRETFNNLAGDIVKNMAPAVQRITARLTKWLENTENQKRIQHDLNEVVKTAKGIIQDLTPFVKTAADMFQFMADKVGGAKHALELLIAVVAGWKVAGLLTSIQNIGVAAAGADGKGGAAGKVASLNSKLARLAKFGVITVSLIVITKALQAGAMEGLQSAGDMLPIYRNGKWVDPTTGKPVKDQAYWNSQYPNVKSRPTHPGSGAGGTGSGARQTSPAATPGQEGTVAGYAKKYGPGSGITYTWGGVSPETGYDCSGFLVAAYRSAGITIPRTTQAQWNDPNALHVPAGQERPGDGIYFAGEAAGANSGPPPRHVGIYVGGGKYIEYFSHGQPARVSTMGSRGDYMGARRWLKIKTSGGGGGTTTPSTSAAGAAPPTSGKGKAAAPKAAQSFQLSLGLREALSEAALTKGTADDIKALNAARKFIENKMGSLKGERKIEALDALKGINDQIAGIEDAANTKRKDAQDAANDKRIAAQKAANAKAAAQLKAHLERLRDLVASKRSAFEDAFKNLAEKAFDAFDQETARGLDKINARFDAETDAEKALREFRDKKAADARTQERADAAAIEDPVERAAALRKLDLEDQEAALEAAADASRKARDEERNKAVAGYENTRQIARDQLDQWLKEQQDRLESGKTQWDVFWKALVTKAGIAGVDVASAFWQQLSSASGQASSALGGLTSAQVAAAVLPVGGSIGGSSSSGYVVGGVLIQPPRFASGGIVTQPTLAMVGDRGPEAIVPLGRGSVTFPVSIGGEHIADIVWDEVRRRAQVFERRNGRSAF